jgi:hypothetical protein
MRKVLNWTSILLIAASAVFIARLWRTDVSPAGSVESITFPLFSQGEANLVEFDTTSETYQALSPREKKEQQRDWLLYAVITSSNRPALEAEQALYDVPPVRSDALAHLGQLETGEARSRVLGSKQASMVALIPQADDNTQADLLAGIADEQRKNTGQIPRETHVFEYQLLPDGEAATVTFSRTLPGQSLFAPEAGYIEARILTLDDLQRFLEATDDLVFARLNGDTLVVGGRRLKSRKMKGIGIEEVATIWKSSRRDSDRLGFSLDPQVDSSLVKANFQQLGIVLPPRLETPLPDYDFLELYKQRGTLGALKKGRGHGHHDELEQYRRAFLAKFNGSLPESVVESLFRQIILKSRFQKARYDGDFQGTEVGMILFYTDLLMKLWGQDQLGSTPKNIPEFPNQLRLNPSAVHEEELRRLAETRLWLGLKETAIQKDVSATALYLGRVATRLFAVPHDSIANRDLKETEPHVFNRIYINWWNQHYAEVAAHEPQYERLNQVVKWSTIIGWLHSQQRGAALDLLDPVMIRTDYWFPDWARLRKELTFKQWDNLGFLTKGYGGSTTEALSIQYSERFEAFGENVWQVSGGVSLAGKTKVNELRSLQGDLAVAVRRAGVSTAEIEGGGARFTSQLGNSFETKALNSGAATTAITAGPQVRLRGMAGEFRSVPFERNFALNGNRAVLQFKTSNATVGELQIGRTSNGLKAGWRARDLDNAYELAKQLSQAPDGEFGLVSRPEIAVVVSRGNGEYFAQFRGSKEWVHLAKRSNPSAEIETGFGGRVSSGPKDPIVEFALIKSSEIEARLGDIAYVEVHSGGRASEGIRLVVAPRPPPGAAKTSLQLDGNSVEGFSHSDRLLVSWKSLPPDIRANPDRIGLALKRNTNPEPSLVVHNFESQSYSEIANKIAQDPKSFRSSFNQYVEHHSKRNLELFRLKQFKELRQEIEIQERRVGEVAEFRLLKALVDLEEGKTAAAARKLDSTGGQSFKRSNGFLDELEARLGDPNISPQKQANLETMKHYVELSNHKEPGAKWGIANESDRLQLRYEREGLEHLKYHPNRKIEAIYVEDSSGLNVNDWTPSNAPTRLRDWVQTGRVEVTQIQDVQLSIFRPSMLVDTKTGTKYRLAHSGTASSGVKAAQTQCSQTSSADSNGQSDPCVAVLIRQNPNTMRPAA